jgi:hypothetical protein
MASACDYVHDKLLERLKDRAGQRRRHGHLMQHNRLRRERWAIRAPIACYSSTC